MHTAVSNEYAAVTQVLGRYYDGLYYGDTNILREAFHPDAHYVTAADRELVHLDLQSYLPRVENRQSPASLGEPYQYTLESVAFADTTVAAARMRCSMLGRHFNDLLSLVKVDDRWRIISKVFSSTPIAPDHPNAGA